MSLSSILALTHLTPSPYSGLNNQILTEFHSRLTNIIKLLTENRLTYPKRGESSLSLTGKSERVGSVPIIFPSNSGQNNRYGQNLYGK
jgi:hypothetical protein